MKNTIFIIIFTSNLLLLLCICSTWRVAPSNSNRVVHKKEKTPAPQQRENITFIMGEDKDPGNQYYTQAANYYRNHPEEGTELVVTCHSLLELRNYLEANPPENGLPWGTVNVVVHSNQWTGIGTPVFPGGKRSNFSLISRAVESGSFPPLTGCATDQSTTLNFHACGLGKNTALLDLLGRAFGGTDENRPNVHSSAYFVNYSSFSETLHPEKQLMDVWYAYYKTGYRPGDIPLSRQLQKRYPDVTVNWRTALKNKIPVHPGGSYHYTFNVPVNWVVAYERASERPELKTKKEQKRWLDEQSELKDALSQYNIPMDKFRWQFEKTEHIFEDGAKSPAIKAKGKVTIICVLKAVE